MPRVNTQTTRTDRTCGSCGGTIAKGSEYRSWSFYRGRPQIRCMSLDCSPSKAELTGSKLSRLYEAQENARADVETADSVDSIRDALREAADVAQEVVDEYREAASAFGDGGPNAEKADQIEPWYDELDSASDNADDLDEDEARAEALEAAVQAALHVLDPETRAKIVTVTDDYDASDDDNARASMQAHGVSDTLIAAFDKALDEELETRIEEKRNEHLEEVRSNALDAINALEA